MSYSGKCTLAIERLVLLSHGGREGWSGPWTTWDVGKSHLDLKFIRDL
jgi:hypothetical protein